MFAGMAKIEIYEDEAGGWRWRCVAANGELVASGEAHTRQVDAERAARTAAITIVTALAKGVVLTTRTITR